MPERHLLVLGLGNVLCSDDGVGPAALARLLRRWEPPAGAEVLDGGTLGMSLMPLLERATDLLLVDAIAGDGPPGTLVRLVGDEVPPAAAHRLSTHQVGVADLIDGLRLTGGLPEKLVLVGLVPETVELGLGRSPRIEAAIPELVRAVLDEAAALGFPFRRRDLRATPSAGSPLGLVHALGV